MISDFFIFPSKISKFWGNVIIMHFYSAAPEWAMYSSLMRDLIDSVLSVPRVLAYSQTVSAHAADM